MGSYKLKLPILLLQHVEKFFHTPCGMILPVLAVIDIFLYDDIYICAVPFILVKVPLPCFSRSHFAPRGQAVNLHITIGMILWTLPVLSCLKFLTSADPMT